MWWLSRAPNTHKVPGSSPKGIKWLLFSTLLLGVDKVIFWKLTSHPKHRTSWKSFFRNFLFTKFSLQMLAEVFKILRPTKNYTRIAGFKVQSANHFTIPPIKCITNMWFVTPRAELNGLVFNFLNHSATFSKKLSIKQSVCIKTINQQISFP